MSDVKDPREFFAKHHQAYVTSARHARGGDLIRLVEGLAPKPGDAALDVATGGGHTAIRVARTGALVTIADITQEMLTDAVNLAMQEGLTLTPVEAFAESLPFADGTYDIVTCRRAAHHFRDVGVFVREVRRVLRPGGRVGISDMTGSTHNVGWLNTLERLRDPSHNRALSPDEWYAHLVAAGFTVSEIVLSEEPMTFEEWLSPVAVDSSDGRRAIAYLRRSDAPQEFVRGTTFIKRRILLWAQR